ncbi:NADP oxidoreductase coenzyme F420-dependent [Burkholderia ambifaria MC40-6]|jgi:predicted dinucleotide-binding enzyme|uniref:NADP oxidoreductase coenzyme F420-dependent n=1 Tax=Burkholderia ambifaria (strain MC40-6) TaxID=398577 RepID=B1YRM5_BURA4|nr:NAD(P)-binding domain-containing protein [Burkholderia ambifaria]ACB64299.1 NADP oxidoreductase coenzyme F420-dependent [Burkholderia ambifaria MC40-6]
MWGVLLSINPESNSKFTNEVNIMEIGIIGTGNIGGTLARRLKTAGHGIRVANSKGPAAVEDFANEIGATAADVKGAISGADVIVLAIPLPAMAKLPADVFDSIPSHVPVIDTSNYYPGLRDSRIPEIDEGMPESVWVSRQLGRSVIKAFNNILAHSLAHLGLREGSPNRLAVAVAGDDDDGKQIVMELVNQIGFDPVNAGSLEDSWRQQPSTPAYCCDYGAAMMRKGLAAAIKDEASVKRDRMPELFAKLGPNYSHDDIVAMNRAANAVAGFPSR